MMYYRSSRAAFVFLMSFLAPLAAEASVEATIAGREENSMAFEGDWSDEDAMINRQDCVDDVEFTFSISVSGEDKSGRELYLFSGSSCDDSDDSDECDDDIIKLDADATSVSVPVSWIIDDADCDDSVDTSVWVGLLESSGEKDDNATWASAIDFDFIGIPPDPPESIDVTPGENNLLVTWEGDDDNSGYLLVFAEADDVEADCSGPLAKGDDVVDEMDWEEVGDGSKESGRVYGLDNYVRYQIAVASVDDNGNPSVLSEIVCGAPAETADFLETYTEAGGQGAGEYCFIATAAFGDYDHPVVRVLREFRDEFLLGLPGGAALVDAYYAVGPTLARPVTAFPLLGAAVRSALEGLAWLSGPLIAIGPRAFLLILALLATAVGILVEALALSHRI